MSTEKKLRFETLQLHVGQENPDPATDARAVPIYQTTSYVFRNSQHAADRFGLRDAGNIYGRLTNSTQGVFEDRVAALEGGVAGLAVASGAAAVTYALQNILQNGDHIVAADNIYGGTYNLITHTLSTQGVSYTIVDPRNFEQVETAIQDNTKALYAETFGNPNSDVTDIDKLAEIAHRHNIPLIIDNTFGTPYLIRPIEHGADIVVHSATKFIGGHGSSLGGVIVDGGKFDWKANADKFPTLAKPDPSYHGAVFADVASLWVATRIWLKYLSTKDKKMRKKSRAMDSEWALEVMHKAPYITVSFIDEDGKPYGLPLSLASDDDVNWYFHGALEGKKLEAIKTHPEVCLSAVTRCAPTVGPKDGSFTLQFKSANAFGKAEIVADEAEKIHGLRLICERFLPQHMDAFDESIARSLSRTAVVRITLTEPPTGKRKQYDKEGVEMKYGRME